MTKRIAGPINTSNILYYISYSFIFILLTVRLQLNERNKNMNTTVIVVTLYGLFSLAGGLIGYVKAGSMASIVAGGISGIILLLSAWGISKENKSSAYVALVVALLLGGRFIMTLIKSFKVMPDLLMVVFSLVTLLMVGIYLLKK